MSLSETPTEIFEYILSKLEHNDLRSMLCLCKYDENCINWSVIFEYRYSKSCRVTKVEYLLDISRELFHKYQGGTKIEKVNLYRSSFLSLQDKSITAIPKEIKYFGHVRSLDLTNNQLTEIPKEILALKNLRELNLSYNCLSKISSKIYGLKNLKHLHIGYNKIQRIDSEVSYLDKLESLHLFGNTIRELSPEIFNMKSLNTLYIQVSISLMNCEVVTGLRTLSMKENSKLRHVFMIFDFLV